MAIVAAIALTTGDSEPEYNGRTFTEWNSAYQDAYAAAFTKTGNGDAAKSSPPAQALRAMTPQIFPTLIRWISYEKSPASERVEDFIEPIADKMGVGDSYSLLIHKGENRTYLALGVFEVLGTNATPAIPRLSNMVMNAKHRDAARNALQAMASTGKAGTQTMVALLHNPNNPNRTTTLAALGLCVSNNRQLVTNEIRQHLTDPDLQIRRIATNVLTSLERHL